MHIRPSDHMRIFFCSFLSGVFTCLVVIIFPVRTRARSSVPSRMHKLTSFLFAFGTALNLLVRPNQMSTWQNRFSEKRFGGTMRSISWPCSTACSASCT